MICQHVYRPRVKTFHMWPRGSCELFPNFTLLAPWSHELIMTPKFGRNPFSHRSLQNFFFPSHCSASVSLVLPRRMEIELQIPRLHGYQFKSYCWFLPYSLMKVQKISANVSVSIPHASAGPGTPQWTLPDGLPVHRIIFRVQKTNKHKFQVFCSKLCWALCIIQQRGANSTPALGHVFFIMYLLLGICSTNSRFPTPWSTYSSPAGTDSPASSHICN